MTNFINQFSGGMSHDDQLMGKEQFVYSHGFDLSRYPGELNLMPKVNIDTTIPTKVTCIIVGERDVYYGTVDGKIYDGAGTLKLDTSTGQPIINSTIFGHDVLGNATIWLFTTSIVLTCKEGIAGLGSLSTKRIGTFIGKTAPVFYGGELYFCGNSDGTSAFNVTVVDKYGNLDDVFDNDTASWVQGLSVIGGYLRVYTREVLAIVEIGGKTVQYSQQLPFVANNVVSDGKIDYVTTDAGELYACSGLEVQQIAEKSYSKILSSYSLSPNKYDFTSGIYRGNMSYSNDRLYIADNRGNYIIYGSKLPGMSKVFCYGSPHYGDNATEIMTDVTALKADGDRLYLAWNTGTEYQVGYVDMNSYTGDKCPEGILITRNQDMGDYSLEKAIQEIRVGMEGVGELYVSINGGTFELVGNLTQTTLYQKIMNYKNNFREISFIIKIQNESGAHPEGSIKNIDLRFTSLPV